MKMTLWCPEARFNFLFADPSLFKQFRTIPNSGLNEFCGVSCLYTGIFKLDKVKSRKYQGVFEVKSRVKTWQVRGIWSQQLEH